MIVRHPGGELFLAGYWRYQDPYAPLQLWRSGDDGESWEAVALSDDPAARGNSDVDLAVGPQGTLYYATMGFDRQAARGTHILVGASTDRGSSWQWRPLSEVRGVDRPWVAVAPDGRAHVIWNDGEGVHHASSDDRGNSWSEQGLIHRAGGSSHLAVGPGGELAVRIAPYAVSGATYSPGVDLIALRVPGEQAWRKVPAPGERDWAGAFNGESVPRWVEPLAFDATGALYSLWSEGDRVYLARSRDLGESWDRWQLAEDEEQAHYPYLVARGSGEVAASFFTGTGDALAVQVVYGRVPLDAGEPLALTKAAPFRQPARSGPPGAVSASTAGEYLPLLFLPEGRLAVAAVMQDAVQVAPGNEQLVDGPQGFLWRVYGLPVPESKP